ncbi:MAG TPA: hypothetical protein VLM40_20925, partial [Gemmata sp.]|nr:hypothetical protein [Gemmata sp.]
TFRVCWNSAAGTGGADGDHVVIEHHEGQASLVFQGVSVAKVEGGCFSSLEDQGSRGAGEPASVPE